MKFYQVEKSFKDTDGKIVTYLFADNRSEVERHVIEDNISKNFEDTVVDVFEITDDFKKKKDGEVFKVDFKNIKGEMDSLFKKLDAILSKSPTAKNLMFSPNIGEPNEAQKDE